MIENVRILVTDGENSVQKFEYVLVLADPVMANILQLWFMDEGGNILQCLNKKKQFAREGLQQ